jgi:hypothetical protein
MSLLATASPYNSENNDSNDISSRRQQSHNRTVKQRKETNKQNEEPEEDELVPMRPNVAAMIKALNNVPAEDGTGLADFNPPPNSQMSREPASTQPKQNLSKNNLRQGFTTLAQAAPYEYDNNSNSNSNSNTNNDIRQGGPKANDDKAIDNSKYNSLPSNYANAYYQQLAGVQNNLQNLQGGLDIENYQILNERLNHIIHLLEEQQNSRTNTVTEELILYCFLGVFIIFIVDSFARVGKYSR